jgi:hypothetical protein
MDLIAVRQEPGEQGAQRLLAEVPDVLRELG